MEVYLIRHGIAAERGTYPQDEERPLTSEGRQKTKKVAEKLFLLNIKLELILTSPLVRALETAEILQKVGLSDKIEEFPPLAPEGDLSAWVNWWQSSYNKKQESPIALVGHQPDLGNWAEMLVWGETQEKLVVKKAGVIGVKLPATEQPVGNSQLFLLSSPKWLL